MFTPARKRFRSLASFAGLWPVAACVLLGANAAIPAKAQAATRALWVWNTSAILSTAKTQSSFFSYLAAPHGKSADAVTKLYFAGGTSASFTSSTWKSQMTSFLQVAHNKGIKVFFLCGDPSWATSSGESAGLSYVSSVLSFNSAATAASGRFDGFQFDVEPYAESGWPSTALENGLTDLLYKAYHSIAASSAPIPLSETIPFWYDSATYNYLDHSVMDLTDEVAIMDYTNTASNLVSYPAAEIAYADQTNKTFLIGVETNQESGAAQTTFYGSTDTAVENVLASDLSTFTADSSFGGYCIDDYTGWSAMAT